MLTDRILKNVDDVENYIDDIVHMLDPDSRYIKDVWDIVAGAAGIDEVGDGLMAKSRAGRIVGRETFKHMSLAAKLYASLVTPETYYYRFSGPELALLKEIYRERSREDVRVRIASVPCSICLEPITLAFEFLKVGGRGEFSILGIDCQEEFLRSAEFSAHLDEFMKFRSAENGDNFEGVGTGHMRGEIESRIRFDVLDLFADELPTGFDMVFCRNILGFFNSHYQAKGMEAVVSMLGEGGTLCLDEYILDNPRGRTVQEWLGDHNFRRVDDSIPTLVRRQI